MKKLSKDEMKKVVGGKLEGNWCAVTVNCNDGTTITIVCDNAPYGCVVIDANSSPHDPENGYAYCLDGGTLTFNRCGVNGTN